MEYLTSDGLNIYYKHVKGFKPCLVFIHGLAGSHESWTNQVNALKGYEQLIIDLRGHGSSSKPVNSSSYEFSKIVSDVKAIIKKEDVKDFILLGFSMGGLVSLNVPGAKKVILVNPVLGKEKFRSSFLLEAFISRYIPRGILKKFQKTNELFTYAGLLDAYATMMLRTPSHVYLSIIKNFPSVSDLRTDYKPMIIYSNKDEIVKHAVIKNSGVHNIKGHHYVIVENHDIVTRLIKDAL
ncbi:MAG TPA: alpha/beta hydrolase [Candidatus Nanoarchaeia archaeon]|nr:alpha/beta hydrolase [Candidatus Nanoarchaeia archaeon]